MLLGILNVAPTKSMQVICKYLKMHFCNRVFWCRAEFVFRKLCRRTLIKNRHPCCVARVRTLSVRTRCESVVDLRNFHAKFANNTRQRRIRRMPNLIMHICACATYCNCINQIYLWPMACIVLVFMLGASIGAIPFGPLLNLCLLNCIWMHFLWPMTFSIERARRGRIDEKSHPDGD